MVRLLKALTLRRRSFCKITPFAVRQRATIKSHRRDVLRGNISRARDVRISAATHAGKEDILTEEEKEAFEEKCMFAIDYIVLTLGLHSTKKMAQEKALEHWQNEKEHGNHALSKIAERVYNEFVLASKKEYAELKKGLFPPNAHKTRISFVECCIDETTYTLTLPGPEECLQKPPHCIVSENGIPFAKYFFNDTQLLSSIFLPEEVLNTLYYTIFHSTYELILEYNRRATAH